MIDQPTQLSQEDSITQWIDQVKQGVEGEPQDRLVERYLGRLAKLARKRLGNLRSYEDEDDVAISAMNSFLMRAPHDDFDRLTDRNTLWSLLVAITIRKTASLQRRQFADKRDINRTTSLDFLLSDPTPQMLRSVWEDANRLIQLLSSELLRQIARAKFEGYTNQEVAGLIGRSPKTVERKLKLIRQRFLDELDKDD